MKNVIQILWKIFLFTFPFSLSQVLYEKNAYRFGNFNPWVTGFLFLPEILLLFIFLVTLFKREKSLTNFSLFKFVLWALFFLFVLNVGVVTYFYGDLTLFGFFLFHLSTALVFYFLLKEELIPAQQTIRWLLFGALFQVVLAFLQVKLNHSLGLSWLGEPHLGPAVSNVAKVDLSDGAKAIRGYGTFLHPNILAAYLLVVLMIALPHLKKVAAFLWPLMLLAGLYLAGSQAAWLGALVAVGLYFIFRFLSASSRKWVAFGFFALIISFNAWFFFNSAQLKTQDPSIAERFEQFQWAHQMVEAQPLGVGVGDFTLQLEEESAQKLMPWQFQPVHNVYFLVASETGLQGLGLFLLLILLALWSYFRKTTDYTAENPPSALPFLVLLMMASFDHLLMTSLIGLFLIALVLWRSDVKV